jgi:hypothetical protein
MSASRPQRAHRGGALELGRRAERVATGQPENATDETINTTHTIRHQNLLRERGTTPRRAPTGV